MYSFFATAAKGTEGALRDELRELGLPKVRADRGGVHFEGTLADGMRACLWSRIAMRVLLSLGTHEARGAEGLYDAVRAIPWEEHLSLTRTFALRATAKDSELTHTQFIAQKAKDAIADRLRDVLGGRPDVDPYRADVWIVVHLAKDRAQISLDLAGLPLHIRGWRVEAEDAPLRETLAAAILRLGGYDPQLPFLDPMCGSGTLAIEAALFARRIAPGRGRHFAFQRWPRFPGEMEADFRALQEEAKEVARPHAPAPILARDRSPEALEFTKRNAQRAGVLNSLTIEQRDARRLGDLPAGCQIFTNPPYGERIGGKRLQLEGFYRGLGEAYREIAAEHPMVVLAGSPLFRHAFGLRPSRPAHRLYNGPLAVDLLTFRPA